MIDMIQVCIPVAIQVIIDDVGWWSGEDSSINGGPFRSGIKRSHVPEDYIAIIELGKKLNMRPMAAMVLCEWDRENVLGRLPSCTWMGKDWNNSQWVGPWLNEAAEILNSNSGNIEIALHGVGHEFWHNESLSRAEWYNSKGAMRPVKDVLGHLNLFDRILEQHHLEQHPESFVPPAFRYHFGLGPGGISPILSDYGIKYINTLFSKMIKSTDLQDDFFGIESGVITLDRGRDLFPWDMIDTYPSKEVHGPICGMHWPALLHPDPGKNSIVVERWVKHLSKYNRQFDHMLARNTAEAYSQIIYNRKIRLLLENNVITFDSGAFSDISANGLLDSFYIKVKSDIKDIKLIFHSDNPRLFSVLGEEIPGQWLLEINLDKEMTAYNRIGVEYH